ncbi:uncharacterized protein CBL_04790 [Carabus blaptoides fortunei]
MFRQNTLLVFAFVCIVKVLCCDVHTKELSAVCKSFSDLSHLKDDSKWKVIKVVNNGNEKLQKLTENSVRNIAQVDQLWVNGLLNGIENSALNNLANLDKLHLEDNEIATLSPGMFDNPSIKTIIVNNSNVQTILPGIFDNLPQLLQVFIVRNHISTIQPNVFSRTNIKDLDLSENGIQFLENNAFIEMKQLETLNLMKNSLTSFDTQRLLSTSPALSLLVLTGNHIQSLSKQMFDGLENLKDLYLGHNNLETLAPNCFHNLKNISRIDISNNKLKELSPDIFPKEGIVSLRDLFLHENQLCFLSAQVLERMPHLRQLSYGGNPWQCPCWELLNYWITDKRISRVCHDEYKQGKLPECIITVQAPTECIFDVDQLKDVPQLFSNQVADYPKPSYCSSIF